MSLGPLPWALFCVGSSTGSWPKESKPEGIPVGNEIVDNMFIL